MCKGWFFCLVRAGGMHTVLCSSACAPCSGTPNWYMGIFISGNIYIGGNIYIREVSKG
jgi:hypothetical protein